MAKGNNRLNNVDPGIFFADSVALHHTANFNIFACKSIKQYTENTLQYILQVLSSSISVLINVITCTIVS